jgi:peptidylprolyl isomerase
MVALGHKVEVAYTGRLADGTVFDSTELHEGKPYTFLVGRQQAIPGFDKAVSEMEPGEWRTVCITPEMGYGLYDERLIEAVPCRIFPHWEDLPIGGYVVLNIDGEVIRCKVLKVEDGNVYIDKNHELAGEDLYFDIHLIHVHGDGSTAIEQELESGCACGCDVLKEAIDPLRQNHDHGHVHGHDCVHHDHVSDHVAHDHEA